MVEGNGGYMAQAEQSLLTSGQRRINMIWELTQSMIAVMIVLANVIVSIASVFGRTTGDYPSVLSSMVFLVLGFYFARTNHEKIGGIGFKPEAQYKGR